MSVAYTPLLTLTNKQLRRSRVKVTCIGTTRQSLPPKLAPSLIYYRDRGVKRVKTLSRPEPPGPLLLATLLSHNNIMIIDIPGPGARVRSKAHFCRRGDKADWSSNDG
jgi:hypothetical protein